MTPSTCVPKFMDFAPWITEIIQLKNINWKFLFLNSHVVKDRVCRFCGILRKIGIVQELKVHFWNAIHQIEGKYLLYNMNGKILYPNLNF